MHTAQRLYCCTIIIDTATVVLCCAVRTFFVLARTRMPLTTIGRAFLDNFRVSPLCRCCSSSWAASWRQYNLGAQHSTQAFSAVTRRRRTGTEVISPSSPRRSKGKTHAKYTMNEHVCQYGMSCYSRRR